VLLHALATRDIGQVEKLYVDGKIAGSRLKQREKLRLGIFERGVRHVVD